MKATRWLQIASLILATVIGYVAPPLTSVRAQGPTPIPNGIFAAGTNPAGYCVTQKAPIGFNNNNQPFICTDAGGLFFANTGQLFAPISSLLTPTIAIGTVATLPAGASATATITGTAPNFTLNLGIPVGAAGIKGDIGPQGPTWSSCTGAAITWTGGNISGTLSVPPSQCK